MTVRCKMCQRQKILKTKNNDHARHLVLNLFKLQGGAPNIPQPQQAMEAL